MEGTSPAPREACEGAIAEIKKLGGKRATIEPECKSIAGCKDGCAIAVCDVSAAERLPNPSTSNTCLFPPPPVLFFSFFFYLFISPFPFPNSESYSR